GTGPRPRSLGFPSAPGTGPAHGAGADRHCRAGALRRPRPGRPCRARSGPLRARVPPQAGRQVSETWATRGWVGVREPPAGPRVTPMSCAPRIPDTSSVAPVLPVARTPALRGVPLLITHSWYV